MFFPRSLISRPSRDRRAGDKSSKLRRADPPMNEVHLNKVPLRESRADIGRFGIYELNKLREWLLFKVDPPFGWERRVRKSGRPNFAWSARFAPSIITRSEAEIFGVSMPRFALRVYL